MISVEFVFNELSTNPFPIAKDQAIKVIENFSRTIAYAKNKHVANIINSDHDLMNINIAQNYSIQDWLIDKSASREARSHLRSYLVKFPIDKNFFNPIQKQDPYIVDFEFNGYKSLGMGYTYLYDLLSLSFNFEKSFKGNPFAEWDKSSLTLNLIQLNEEGNAVTSNVSVKNVSRMEHVDECIRWIQEIKNQRLCTDITELWKNRTTLYPNLIFLNSIQKELNKFSGKANTFLALKSQLGKLNLYGYEFQKTKKYDSSKIGAIDTSPQTQSNTKLNNTYIFNIPSLGNKAFYQHVYIANEPPYRIYFYPDSMNGTIYIGYLGHLPVIKYPKLHL